MLCLQDRSLPSRPGSRSAGARPSSVLANVMSLMMGNPELPPISIVPSDGTIQPGDTENFSICFSPLEVSQFQGRLLCRFRDFNAYKCGGLNLTEVSKLDSTFCLDMSFYPFSIPNLQEDDQAPCIPVCGNSLFPYYHFDLEDSDYISRRSPEFRAHLEPNIRVIELNAVGFSAPSTK